MADDLEYARQRIADSPLHILRSAKTKEQEEDKDNGDNQTISTSPESS